MGQKKSIHAIYRDRSFSEFGKPCDAILKIDNGTEFKVYSKPLSCQSEFFRALFSIEEEGEEVIPTVHGLEPDVFETVLVYLYTGKVRLSTKNMTGLLLASDFLMIDSLLRECRRFVMANITTENCVGLYLTAYRIKGLDMEEKCRRFLLMRFEKATAVSMEDALELPLDPLVYFLSHKSVNVSGERAIWSFMETWVTRDPRNRMPSVPTLLRCLSISEIDEGLASSVISSPIIRDNHLYEGLKYPRKGFLSKTSKARTIVTYHHDVPFLRRLRRPPCVYFVTRMLSGESGRVEMFVSYDDRLDAWRKLGSTSKCGRPLALLSANRRVYVFAGGYEHTRMVVFYQPNLVWLI